jgi:peptidylprolyl isomerase
MKGTYMIRYLILSVLMAAVFVGCDKGPEGLFAEIETQKGMIQIQLEFEKAPLTVSNFVGLAEGTIQNDVREPGIPFYDGLTFHRVVPNHVIQTGDPDGSKEGPGYTFVNEIHPQLKHSGPGIVGMANAGPHTNGSQFYITHLERSYLDGDYTVFGSVVSGMDVVNQIKQGDKIIKIKIIRRGKTAKAFRPSTESFQQLAVRVTKRVEAEFKARKEREASFIRSQWPEAYRLESGLLINIDTPARRRARLPRENDRLTLHYTGKELMGKTFIDTRAKDAPLEFVMGTTRINRGFDEAVSDMRQGEKRTIVVPPELAYGSSGFYHRNSQGKMEIAISPHTTLVYEIEVLEITRP